MVIGIDLGTTSVKLLLVEENGEIIRSITKYYPLSVPKPNWSEQDPLQWFDQTLEGLKELVKDHENQVQAISFSGQMHGLVMLDQNDHVIRPAILWNDQRTDAEVNYLNKELGIDFLMENTNNIALTGLTLPKLMWIKKHEPHHFELIRKVMLPKDYLAYRLSGVFATDESDVSGTLYFDVKEKKYSKAMLDITGLDYTHFPPVYSSTDIVGNLKEEYKQMLGIKREVNIIIGGGDQAVGAVGIGVINQGDVSISLGTSGVVFVASDKCLCDHQSYLQSYCHATGKYHMMGVMLNAAGSLKWWHEQVHGDDNYAHFFDPVESAPIDDSLFFLPYLTGERAPINDPYASGALIGLRTDHRMEHINRSIIEGVSFALKQSLDLIRNLGIDIYSIKITGGGAKSPIWAQMISDVMNVSVSTLEVEEGPAFGAVILALVGNQNFPSVEKACQALVKIKKTYTPNAGSSAIYQKKYRVFCTLYSMLKPFYAYESIH